jgi:hypothetical protein
MSRHVTLSWFWTFHLSPSVIADGAGKTLTDDRACAVPADSRVWRRSVGGHGDEGMSDCTERSEGQEGMPKVGTA